MEKSKINIVIKERTNATKIGALIEILSELDMVENIKSNVVLKEKL